MSKHLFRPNIWLILVIYLLLAVAFGVASPVFEAPDELQHFAFARYLANTHTLPVLDESAMDAGQALYAQEGAQPPLYYAIGAVIISGVPDSASPPAPNPHANIGVPREPGNKNVFIHGPDEAWPWQDAPLAVHLLRLLSTLLGAGTVFFVWKIARGLFPHQEMLALAAAAFVAFLPQFLFISAAVTNDTLIIFLSTFILWLMLWWFGPDLSRSPGWAEALLLGMFLGFAALSKLSGLYLWGMVTLAYLIHLLSQRDWKQTLPMALLTGLAAVVIAFPWYWRNWLLYGDATALAPFLAIVGPRQTPIHFIPEFQGLRVSLLGLFGWFNIPLPEHIYQIWDAFLVVSAIGFLQGVWRRRFHLRPLRRRAFLILLGLWLLSILLALIIWTSKTPGTQARLIFPAIASLGILLMIGWREWLPTKAWWLSIPPALLLALSIYSVGWVLPAAYRPPQTISPDDIPMAARIEPRIFDGRIILMGASVDPATVHPGEEFDLTLYWQAREIIPYDASIFIHVLGRDYADVAQINSYPGWGTAPTSQWQPGKVLVDRYQIHVPGGTVTPTRLVVDVGLYDHDTKRHYVGVLASGETMPLGVASLRAIPQTDAEPDISHPLDVQADGIIQLAGYDLPDETYHPGQSLSLTLYWQGLAPMDEDYQIFVHLLDESGQQVAGFDKTPVDGWWPTSLWEPGQTFADSYPLVIPEALPEGQYQLQTGLYRLQDLYRLPLTGPPNQVSGNAAVLTNITVSP
jgi:hypothetical protein